jgi:hypothetical protein
LFSRQQPLEAALLELTGWALGDTAQAAAAALDTVAGAAGAVMDDIFATVGVLPTLAGQPEVAAVVVF